MGELELTKPASGSIMHFLCVNPKPLELQTSQRTILISFKEQSRNGEGMANVHDNEISIENYYLSLLPGNKVHFQGNLNSQEQPNIRTVA